MAQAVVQPGSEVQRWINHISAYDKAFKKWETRAQKIVKRYLDEGRSVNTSDSAKFPILWSNVQTIVPAVFSRLPKPDVSRRFKDNDPVGRVAALLLERGLEFEIEHYPDYRAAMENSVQDRFLGGRGIAWVRYEPKIKAQAVQVTEDADTDAANDGVEDAAVEEQLENECAPVDYVHWKDFGHVPARTWEEVPAVWRRVYMKREALVERFGKELGDKIPLDTKPEAEKQDRNADAYEACIYEIWDKASGKALWLSKGMPDLLDEVDDPLQLETFWPCPRPLYATLSTDSLVPTPDFVLYQDQANTLDLIADRIDGLVKALQVKGIYDASVPELARIFTEGSSGQMLPVKNWQAFAEKNGLRGTIDLVDLTPIFNALKAAYEAMEQQKAQVFEITGLSDIIRGQSEATETATAQQIKGQYASLRLRRLQGQVAQFAAELLQIKAQIMCRFFQPETLAKIAAADQLSEADKQHVDAALALLKNAELSEFRIEVSADSLVQIDEAGEKEAASEFVEKVGSFIKAGIGAPPEVAPLMGSLLKWAAARFKVGKAIEGEIDAFVEQAKQAAMQPKGPSPEQIKAQAEQAKLQAEGQRSQQEGALEQMRMQLEAMTAQREQEREDARLRMEAQTAQMEAMQKAASEEAQRRFEAMQADAERRFQLLMQGMKDATTLQVAQVGQQTTLQSAQISAANVAAGDQGA